MHILIGNLNLKTTTSHLSNLFLQFGLVKSVRIIADRLTGHSLGYGYVEMDNNSGASAIYELNSVKFMNYYLEVSEAPM